MMPWAASGPTTNPLSRASTAARVAQIGSLGTRRSSLAYAVVFATRSGALSGWNLGNGQRAWSLDLGSPVGGAGSSAGPGDDLGVFLTPTGTAVVTDLTQGRRLWDVAPGRAGERDVSAMLGPKGLCVLTADGRVRYFTRTPPTDGKAKAVWEKALDGPGPTPCVAGDWVLAASRSGSLHAMSAVDGRELWRAKAGGRPTHVAVFGKTVCVLTVEGRLALFNLE